MKTLLAMACVIILVTLTTGCQQNTTDVSAVEPATETTTTPVEITPTSQTAVESSVSSKKAGNIDTLKPLIEIENPIHDFGNIAPDSTQKCQYKFKNVGKGALKISHVQSTCGCSVPEISKKEYEPGESGAVDVTFHAPAYPGLVTKHLYIVSNDPVNPRAELTLKGTVIVKVFADPNKIELASNKENGGMPTLKVKSVDNVPFAITGFSATGQIATLKFDPTDKKTEHLLTPTVDVSKLQEINSGIIQIRIDHPETKEVSVIFNSVPMFELRPPRIILQNTEPGAVTKREVWIVNNFGKEFEIESITSRNGYMKVVNQKKEGLNIGLDVEITPPVQQETRRRYITDELTIKIKNGPTLTVRCSGWFKIG